MCVRRLTIHSNIATRRIGDVLLKVTDKRRALLDCFERFVNGFRGHIKVGHTRKDLGTCHGTCGRVTEFLRTRCELSSVPFSTLSHSFVSGCSLCLQARQGLTPKAVVGLAIRLGAMIDRTVTSNVVATDPFLNCRPIHPGTMRGCLASRRLRQVVAAPLRERALCRIHSVFLFSYFANVSCESVHSLAGRGLSLTRSNA